MNGICTVFFCFNIQLEEILNANLYIVGQGYGRAQSVVVKETRNTVLGICDQKAPNFKLFRLCAPSKILKKHFKKGLHSGAPVYIIQRLVKREEAGSYRASG